VSRTRPESTKSPGAGGERLFQSGPGQDTLRPEGLVADVRGGVFVVCSPSGGGKTTIIRRAMAELAGEGRCAYFSVSHTTRQPRQGEVDGVDYHFVSREAFVAMVSQGSFLEHAEYVGNLYGTSRQEIAARLEEGCDVFLDIDVQGASQIREALPEAVHVFILPPSFAVLKQRLIARGKDDLDTVMRRIRQALREMRELDQFDYAIINDRLEEASHELARIVNVARLRPTQRRIEVQAILDSFETALGED
jgi:guanylate kinase